jgi:hypothetical protein
VVVVAVEAQLLKLEVLVVGVKPLQVDLLERLDKDLLAVTGLLLAPYLMAVAAVAQVPLVVMPMLSLVEMVVMGLYLLLQAALSTMLVVVAVVLIMGL